MKRPMLWTIELLMWLFIIVAVAYGVNYYKAAKVNKESTYHIFMNDVYGLKEGSPIKIMGVQVGYVTEINVIDDYIYVSFLISKKGVSIPHGAVATVESYGMAGSKSIELYPPTQKVDKTQPVLFVKNPIRSNSNYSNSGSIAKSLIRISEGTSAKLSTKTNEQHQQNIQNLVKLTESIEFQDIDDAANTMIKTMQTDIDKRKAKNE